MIEPLHSVGDDLGCFQNFFTREQIYIYIHIYEKLVLTHILSNFPGKGGSNDPKQIFTAAAI